MNKKLQARILGLGSYVPERILTNIELEKMVDTTDEWIISRTGIKERRIASENEYTSSMGSAAAKNALESAKINVEDIDIILVATLTPDYLSNAVGPLIQSQIGANKVPAFDIAAACTGFIYALSVAKAYIEAGMYKNILLVASEKMSMYVDYKDRGTCILFGDGASAAVISSQGKGLLIDNVCLGSDGELSKLVYVPAGGACHPTSERTIAEGLHTFRMQGTEVFKNAVRRMVTASEECLLKAGLKKEQLSWLVPHQANLRIMDAIAKNFDIPSEKMFKTVHKYGNTSASSVPIALDELLREHTIRKGEHILLTAFGAGLTWGASLLTMVEK